MYAVPNIKYVIVDDIQNPWYDDEDPKSYTPGGITLGVSNDDKVRYDHFEGIITREKDEILFLDNYHGKLLLPKHCGLQIKDSDRDISGLIDFPAYIDSYRQITVMIEKDSGLELIVSTYGGLTLNGKKQDRMIPIESTHAAEEDKKCEAAEKVKKILSTEEIRKIPYTIGLDFSLFEYKFTRHNNKLYPEIIEDNCGRIADFGNVQEFNPVQVCMEYNLVVIDSDMGEVNVYYKNFNPQKAVSGFRVLRDIRRLERDIEIAKKTENYERIIVLNKQLETLKIKRSKIPQKNAPGYPENKHEGNQR